MTPHAAVSWASAQVETARLLLRPVRAADAEPLRRARDDAAVRRWATGIGTDDPDTLRPVGGWRGVLTDLDSGALVGAAELRPVPAAVPTARLGLWIAAPVRRGGLGTEVVAGLSGWAFRNGVSRAESLAAVGNEPAQRVALAAGFRREGQLRSAVPDGAGRADAVLFARLASDPPTAPKRPLPDVAELSDGVVTLRPMRAGDEEAVLDERCDPLTQRWATTSRLWTMQDARAYVAATGALWLAGGEARFAIVDTATGTYAGSIGMRMTVAPFGIAEIGYGLRAGWRGRGLTVRAVRLVADWAFSRTGVTRLELGTAIGNAASQRVAERAGFRREGVAGMRLPTSDGGRTDEVRFGLVRPR